MIKIFIILAFLSLALNSNSQTKRMAQAVSQSLISPKYRVDLEKDTVNMVKIMAWKDRIIKEHAEGRAFVYSEIQGNDSLSWFVYPGDVCCYVYNKNLPNLVFYKKYGLKNNKISECGYYYNDHTGNMFMGYGIQIGMWRFYDDEGTMWKAKDYDAEVQPYPWYKALSIAIENLKCQQKDLTMTLWQDDFYYWEINYKNEKYKIDTRTGNFSKMPKCTISVK